MTSRTTSADGTGLAYYVTGRADGPTVVAVHGYPDNHAVWDGVVAELGGEFRMVTYDVRGCGASDRPDHRAGYRIPRLVDDLHAVVEAVDDGRPVHLVGHDWGSIQCWPALTDPRLTGRIASFLSISGPSLDHAAAWLRRVRTHPGASLGQVLHSYYMLLFQVPRLPESAIRRGLFDRLLDPAPYRTRHDQVNGLELYRANLFRAVARPRPQRIDVPVLVLALEQDEFVSPRVCVEAPAPHVRDLRTRTVPGGHWSIFADPRVVAGCVREFVGSVGSAGPGVRSS